MVGRQSGIFEKIKIKTFTSAENSLSFGLGSHPPTHAGHHTHTHGAGVYAPGDVVGERGRGGGYRVQSKIQHGTYGRVHIPSTCNMMRVRGIRVQYMCL